jgi:hypothetical protein
MNEAILSKLQKLLALSKGGSENEAQLALEKAQQIATQHNIELAAVAAREPSAAEKLEMVEDHVTFGRRLPTLQKYASWLLGSHFGVKLVYHNTFNGRQWVRQLLILGDKRDVEFAKYVNSFVQEDMQRRWEYYKKSNNLATRYKSTWMYNCWRGLDSKLKEAKKKTEEAAFSAVPPAPCQASEFVGVGAENVSTEKVKETYALMITDKASKVEKFLSERHPTLRSYSTARIINRGGSVASDGFATGRTMTIARPLAGQSALN